MPTASSSPKSRPRRAAKPRPSAKKPPAAAPGEDAFEELLRSTRADSNQALALGQEIGGTHRLNEASILMLGQVLFEARRNEEPGAMSQAATTFARVLAAVASSRRADASVMTAETRRSQFRYNAARAALAHVAELQKINRSSKTSEREKIERAVERLFGKPEEKPAAEIAAVEVTAA